MAGLYIAFLPLRGVLDSGGRNVVEETVLFMAKKQKRKGKRWGHTVPFEDMPAVILGHLLGPRS